MRKDTANTHVNNYICKKRLDSIQRTHPDIGSCQGGSNQFFLISPT
jgi:hypothetical protein